LDAKNYKSKDFDYLIYNERKVSVFYCPAIKGRFYIVQVADKQVDTILNWKHGEHITQGDRFGQIRYGSQCDIVIPLNDKIEYAILVKKLTHVEAGIDPIVRVKKGKQ
jgi:phosphatidylserine decarboxylase